MMMMMMPVEISDEASNGGKKKSTSSSCLPLLVFQHQSYQQHTNNNEHDMLMFSVSQKRLLHAADIEPDLVAGNNMCWTTPQGWMLVKSPSSSSSSSSTAWLWNPSTEDKIALPDVEAEYDHEIPMACKCLLTHKDAAHPGCFVVLFDYKQPNMWYCKVIIDGGGWRRYTYDVGDYEVPGNEQDPPRKNVISSIAAVSGELFFIDSAEEMCAIDFTAETFTTCDDEDPKFLYFDVAMVDFPEGMDSGRSWLVESDDQLFLVCICFIDFDAGNIGAVLVHRMDFSTEAWCRVHDIGDVVFLLEDANVAASCPASTLGLKPNQIYFMKDLVDDDADLCVFDVEWETMEIARVHQHDDLPLCRKPFWILPPTI